MSIFIRELGKRSVERYNHCKPLRFLCRTTYRTLSRLHCTFSSHQLCLEYLATTDPTKKINIYPWPYRDPTFGNYGEEVDTLVVDQLGFVIRHSTSYCAYRLKVALGYWPKRKQRKRYDAKNWQEYLSDLGFTEVVDCPDDEHCYIGIKPDYGEFGLVVWFEHVQYLQGERTVIVSTYFNNEYQRFSALPSDYTWITIN